MSRFLLSFVALGTCCVALAQQGSGSMPGFRFALPPKIDGVIQESEWQGAPTVTQFFDENTSQAAPEGSTMWLGYDDKFVYFAARCDDAQPQSVKAKEYRTNVSIDGDDFVGVEIDPFGRLSDWNEFAINPRGATSLSIAGGRAAKREWLGEIQAAGRITATGWEAEARIPWSIMRLPSAGQHDLRVNFYRYFQRYQRGYQSSLTAGGHIENYGRWLSVTLPPPPPKTLKLLPYGYIGGAEDEGLIANAGLDLKTSLTDQIELVGSINPDFRNIENDILSLDFSYFERLADETRPFFLEGQDYFGTSLDAPLFVSQRIPNFDAGFKAYGKLDPKTEFGLLNTSDFGNQNNFVFSGQHHFSEHTGFKLAVASLERPDLSNLGSYMSLSHQLGAYNFFAQSEITRDSELSMGQRYNVGGVWNKGVYNGLLEYTSITSRFLPRLGFAPERNFQGVDASFGMRQLYQQGAVLSRKASVYFLDWNRFDGDAYRQVLTFDAGQTWRNGLNFAASKTLQDFHGHKDDTTTVGMNYPKGNLYANIGADYTWGRVAGSSFRLFTLDSAYRASQPLQLQLSYQSLEFQGHDEQLILTGSYDLGNDRSLVGRAVRRGDDVNAYIAYRRSGNKGTEYFLIVGDPNSRKWRNSLILKVTYPLEVIWK